MIVVDNGSTDESLDIARSYRGHDRYTLIENAENTGFSHAVNQGIAIAKGEYAVLFNNDAFAEPDWLAELIKTADADPKNAFSIEDFLRARLKLKPNQVCDVYEIDAAAGE